VPGQLPPPLLELLSKLPAIDALDVMIQPVRKHTNSHRLVLATELELGAAIRTPAVAVYCQYPYSRIELHDWSDLHNQRALVALLDSHAAHILVEVAEDVVEVGAPVVGRKRGGFTLTILALPDGGGAAVVGRGGVEGLGNWSA
jgi:hypothetical protein